MHGGYTQAMIGAGVITAGIATGGVGFAVAGIAGGYLVLSGADNFVAGARNRVMNPC